jgi:hypothetical protein
VPNCRRPVPLVLLPQSTSSPRRRVFESRNSCASTALLRASGPPEWRSSCHSRDLASPFSPGSTVHSWPPASAWPFRPGGVASIGPANNPEPPATFSRNRWPTCAGINGPLQPAHAVAIDGTQKLVSHVLLRLSGNALVSLEQAQCRRRVASPVGQNAIEDPAPARLGPGPANPGNKTRFGDRRGGIMRQRRPMPGQDHKSADHLSWGVPHALGAQVFLVCFFSQRLWTPRTSTCLASTRPNSDTDCGMRSALSSAPSWLRTSPQRAQME